jgi:PAS domain S-box-containing protein
LSESSQELYRAIFQASPDGVLIVDEEGTIRDLNPRAERLFGYGRDELVGQKVELLVPEATREGHVAQREAFTERAHPRPMGVGLDLRGVTKDGDPVPLEISLSPLETEEGGLVIAAVRDMTQRKRLRDFGTGALRASEEERQRIARELHDDTAQHLATLLVQIEVLQRAEGDVDWQVHLDNFRQELKACAEGVRRIARGLRPPELEDAGVEAALRSHLRAVQEVTPIRMEIDLQPVDALLDSDTKLVLYRIVQEAVSNAARHAAASTLWIEVARDGREVVAKVRDDGAGFRPETDLDGGGLGLVGMQERAVMVGGRVAVRSRPGEGTTVNVRIPVDPAVRLGPDGEGVEAEHV